MRKTPNAYSKIAAYAMRALMRLSPRHIKRLVFWTAVYSSLKGNTSLSSQAAERLNQTMDLTVNPAALQAPVAMSSILWPDVEKCVALVFQVQEAVQDSLSESFAQSVPEWCRYANLEFIRNDLRKFAGLGAHIGDDVVA